MSSCQFPSNISIYLNKHLVNFLKKWEIIIVLKHFKYSFPHLHFSPIINIIRNPHHHHHPKNKKKKKNLSTYASLLHQPKSCTISYTIPGNQESMWSVQQIVMVKQLGAQKIRENGYLEIFLWPRKYILDWYLGWPLSPLANTYHLPPLSCTLSIPELS